jgi:hypothetical protein
MRSFARWIGTGADGTPAGETQEQAHQCCESRAHSRKALSRSGHDGGGHTVPIARSPREPVSVPTPANSDKGARERLAIALAR